MLLDGIIHNNRVSKIAICFRMTPPNMPKAYNFDSVFARTNVLFFRNKNKCKVSEKTPLKVGRQMSFAMTFSAQVNTEAIKALTMKLFIFQKQLP